MTKTCFVIMPISDMDLYEPGHFNRVYEYIIKPASIKSGFEPVRADDIQNTNYIALDIIKRILTSDMAICDLSSKNPNVLYELGLRQAFNLPVTLIRDHTLDRIFDIQGIRDVEYDSNLRIDNVNTSINRISETLTNTYETKGKEINSLVSLLGILPAEVPQKVEVSKETMLILDSISAINERINSLERFLPKTTKPVIQFPLAEPKGNWIDYAYNQVPIDQGDYIDHNKFGKGMIVEVNKNGQPTATVLFHDGTTRKLMLHYAKLKLLIKDPA